MQRVINTWEIKKPYNQNIILQIDLNTEEEYVQAGLLFQTFYFSLKLKKKKKQKKTTDMSMAEWVSRSSWEMNHTFHSVLWKPCFEHACNYYLLHTSQPRSQVYKDLVVFWESLLGHKLQCGSFPQYANKGWESW